MNLPRLVNVSGLPFSLPVLPEYQTWAINQDTSPPSLVIVEFPYSRPPEPAAAANTLNLLNTTVGQTSMLINTQLQNIESRVTTLEGQLSNTPISTTGV